VAAFLLVPEDPYIIGVDSTSYIHFTTIYALTINFINLLQYMYNFHTDADAHPVTMSMIRSLVVGALLASAVSAKTINVKVGDGSLTYSPNSTKAEVGDEVAFIFYPLNHTVNQASFSNPCIPLKDGFFSGFINSSSGPASNEFVITVKDTSPIWFYCGQAAHCENGMVGVINEP
jgi:plastocyanin